MRGVEALGGHSVVDGGRVRRQRRGDDLQPGLVLEVGEVVRLAPGHVVDGLERGREPALEAVREAVAVTVPGVGGVGGVGHVAGGVPERDVAGDVRAGGQVDPA